MATQIICDRCDVVITDLTKNKIKVSSDDTSIKDTTVDLCAIHRNELYRWLTTKEDKVEAA